MKQIFTFLILLWSAVSAQGQLHIANGGSIFLKGNATLSLNNTSLINDGTFTAEPAGRVLFDGNAINQISGDHNPDFGILEIAKTGSGWLQLHTRIIVATKITFTSGLIDLGDYDIDLGTTGYLDGEKEDSRLTGTGTGEVMVVTSLESPSSANPGNLGLHITSFKNIGLAAVKRGHRSLTNGSRGYGIGRYYVVDPINNEGLNATLRFHYFDAERNSLDENTFALWQSGVDANRWTEHGLTARNTTLNWVEKTGLDSLRRLWTLSPAGALPVTGMDLSGVWKNNAAYLKWTTYAEHQNSHFIVERRYSDEMGFTPAGKVLSAHVNGTSATPANYQWIDRASQHRGQIFYRLQQWDRNGQVSYSKVITLRPDAASIFIANIYPTVNVKNQIYIETGDRDFGDMRVFVFDMNGKIMLERTMQYQSQWLQLPSLSTGMYKLVIRSAGEQWQGSFVK